MNSNQHDNKYECSLYYYSFNRNFQQKEQHFFFTSVLSFIDVYYSLFPKFTAVLFVLKVINGLAVLVSWLSF
jgi:hypothetical protein